MAFKLEHALLVVVVAGFAAEWAGRTWGARGLLGCLAAAVLYLLAAWFSSRVPRRDDSAVAAVSKMRLAPDDADLQLGALAALRERAAASEDERAAALAHGAAAVAWAAFTRHVGDNRVAVASVAALRALSGSGDAAAVEAVAAAVDSALLIRRAKLLVEDAPLCRWTLQLLGVLAGQGTAARTELVDNGAFEFVVEGMREHEDSAEEQQWGAWCGFQLSFEHPGNKVYGAQRGALAAVIRAMDLHGQHRGLVEQGVAAMANFMMDAKGSVAAAARPVAQNLGAVNTLSNARHEFPQNAVVQQLAGPLIQFLAQSSSEGQGFDVRGPEVVQFLGVM